MGNTQKAIQKKETQHSSAAQQAQRINLEKKQTSIKITARVKAPTLLQQMQNRQHDHPSLNEATYMNEDLFCINNEEKLKEPLHRSVGALIFWNLHNQRGVGSGILISQDTVLTAAHNVYNRLLRQKNKNFRFYLGANGEIQHYYQIQKQSWKYPDQYQTCKQNVSRQYDYAIMKLKKPVVHFSEFLPMKIPCSICLLKNNSRQLLKVYGFPATYEQRPNEKPIIYKDNCKILSEDGKKISLFQYGLSREDRIRFFDITGKIIGYQMSTLPGQSGAPVIIDNCIIAIHSGNGDRKQFNEGRIIDQDLLKNVKSWRDQLGTQPFNIKVQQQCDIPPYIMGTFTMTDKSKVQRIGFGIVISKNLVLTAAHNIFDRNQQRNYENFRFYLGSTINTGERFIQIASFNYPTQFKTCSTSQQSMYNYALVMLKEQVPCDQFMKMSVPCHQCINNNKESCLDIYGFPKYTCEKRSNASSQNLIKEDVMQIKLFQYRIFHVEKILEIDTQNYQMQCLVEDFQGQNVGAPLIFNNRIIGINLSWNKSNKINVMRLIDKQFAHNIKAWSRFMNGAYQEFITNECPFKKDSFYQRQYGSLIKFYGHKNSDKINHSFGGIMYLNKFKNKSVATGVLLSKNIMLTSAFNCYDKIQKFQYTNHQVRFVQNDGISKSFFEIQNFRYPQQFKTCLSKENIKYDYALLKLKTPVNYHQFPKISLP